ncbi:MAG: N-acetylmuramoyl-L-alanine amidase [Lachnospiraceae bacterium]|nr:N-acetylmuramoyl-L-alanine amidase [Lachnospiraceae bacterium]
MNIIQQTAVKNPNYQAGQRITPKGIMIHSIGVPQPDPKVIADNFNQGSADSCVHAVIGTGEEVYQLLPWDYRAWHCGSGPNGSGNGTYISFEMTEPSTIRYTSGAEWTDLDPEATRSFVLQTYARAVELAAYLCRLYGLDPQEEGVLISHAEGHRMGIASNHADVEHIWDREGLSMAQFRKDVAKAIETEEDGENGGESGAVKYIVQAGAFEREENARRLVEQLKAAGFPSYIKEV